MLALVLRTTERCTGTWQKVRLYKPLRRGSWQMSRQVAADMRSSIWAIGLPEQAKVQLRSNSRGGDELELR